MLELWEDVGHVGKFKVSTLGLKKSEDQTILKMAVLHFEGIQGISF